MAMEEDMELCSLASDEGLPCCDVISSASHVFKAFLEGSRMEWVYKATLQGSS